MSKGKPAKPKGIPSRHLHARTSFLYQAATYLTLQTLVDDRPAATPHGSTQPASAQIKSQSRPIPTYSPLALHLGSDLQQVSRKAQLRLAVHLKRTICKCCNTVLIPGHTATQTMENASRASKKPWADVVEILCRNCHSRKRFPVGNTRQQDKNKARRARLALGKNTAAAGLAHCERDGACTELDASTG